MEKRAHSRPSSQWTHADYDLIALTPGAAQTGTSPIWSMNTGVTISAAGGQNYGVLLRPRRRPEYQPLRSATNMPLPFPRRAAGIQGETSTQNAQTGTHSGAQVNMVTKSGHEIVPHGDAFEFFRNRRSQRAELFRRFPRYAEAQSIRRHHCGLIKKNKFYSSLPGHQGHNYPPDTHQHHRVRPHRAHGRR